VTLGGSAKPEGTRSHDLERCSTRADFARRSTHKKSVASADASPISCQTARWLPGSPLRRRPPGLPRGCPIDRFLRCASLGRTFDVRALRRRWINPHEGRSRCCGYPPPSQVTGACGHSSAKGSGLRSGASCPAMWSLVPDTNVSNQYEITIAEKRMSRTARTNLPRLCFNTAALFLFSVADSLGCYLLYGGTSTLERRQHLPGLLCTSEKNVMSELRKE